MKHLAVVTVFLLISVFLLEIKRDDSVSTLRPPKINEELTKEEKSNTLVSDEEVVLRKWRSMERILQDSASTAVRRIFPFIVEISEKVNISSQCSRSILKLIYGIKQVKSLAFKMIDASGKIPNGLFSGYFTSLGDFDGCLSVDVSGSTPFRGQYCSVFINPPLPKRKLFHKATEQLPEFVNFTKKGTVTDEALKYVQYFTVLHPRTSICVPSTCSREEIASIIDTLTVSVGFPWNISVPTCVVKEPVVLSKSHIAIICVLSVIALFVLAGTMMDIYLNIYHKEKREKMEASSTTVKCLMCFSAYNNTLKILKKDTSPESIKIFHGMKVITVQWVALTHVYGYTPFTVAGGCITFIDFAKSYAFQVIVNAVFGVQTFFFISAVLVAYGRTKFMGNHINIPMYIFHRLWRLTPTFMFVIATSMLVPQMGSGPAWKEIVGSLIEKCEKNWWTNLVYINNFISADKVCFHWLWYIAADTQLYLLALLVVIPLKSRPKLAFGINGLLFFSGIIVSAVTHVYYKQMPTLLYIFPDKRDINYYIEKGYFRTYVHIQTYCVGLFTGYVLAIVPKIKIPKVINICGWLISVTVGVLVVYGVYDWNQGNIPGLAVSTLYACTSKFLWNLALCYVTIACFTGNGGIITSLLSWSPFVPLGRLTFSFYIVHPIIYFIYMGSSRTLILADHKTWTYIFLGTTVMSYLVAYIVSLLFESPFISLMKVILSAKKSSKAPKQNENGLYDIQGKRSNKIEVSVISMKKIEEEML